MIDLFTRPRCQRDFFLNIGRVYYIVFLCADVQDITEDDVMMIGYHPTDESDQWRVSIIKEVLEIRSGEANLLDRVEASVGGRMYCLICDLFSPHVPKQPSGLFEIEIFNDNMR